MTMKAATAQLKAYVRLVQDNRIKPAALRYAKKEQMTVSEVMDAVSRVKERRASLEIQSAPARYKTSRDEMHHENEPTPQWKSKAQGHIETRQVGTDIRTKGYRIRPVVEQHGEKFSLEKKCALERFVQDGQYCDRISIADWNRSGGGTPGSRLGGLGNVPQTVRDGHHRFEWILARLDPGSRQVADYLILRAYSKPDGTPFSLEDFGRTMFPTIRNPDSLKWAAAGAVWSLGAKLLWLYQQTNCPRVRRLDEIDE